MNEPDRNPIRASDREQSGPASGASLAADAEEQGGSFPVDPMRLLGGLWKRKSWIILGLLLGATLGFGLGLLRLKTRYVITVQLIKRELPSAFRVGEIGEAFRPHQLSGGTLMGTASSINVLQRVADKSSPPVSVDELKGSIEVKDMRNTDFVFLTLSGYKGRVETAKLANLWAAEVVQFTRDLQSQESREIRQFLQLQVDKTDADLRTLNTEILEFSRRENLVDADKQIDAYLRALSEVDLKCESTRIDLETIDFKIKGIENELRRQSPLIEKWRNAKTEVEDLRGRYTDQNPLVVEKLEKMKDLEKEIKEAEGKDNEDLSGFAGTALGNTLFLSLVQFQDEKKALTLQKEELEKLREQERVRLNAIPEKAAAFAQLSLKKQSLETARNLLFSRLREAQLFEDNAPGYYQIFAPAGPNDATVKSRLSKTIMFTVGLGIFFAFAAAAMALLVELLDPRLCTGSEAAKAFGAPLFATLSETGAGPSLGAEVWARWIGSWSHPARPRIIWSPSPGPEDQEFWTLMFERASTLLPSLRLIDCGADGFAAEIPASIRIEQIETEAFSIAAAIQLGERLCNEARTRREETWIRLCGPVHEPLASLAKCGEPPLIIVRLNAEESDFWKTQNELIQQTIGRIAGIVAVGDIPVLKRK